MFVLDTDVVSELRKVRSGEADIKVAAWAGSVDAVDLYLSAITILELELEVLLKERSDSAQGAIPRAWLGNQVLTEFAERILTIDVEIARCCASLHLPDPRPERDALIAATALVHGMTAVTGNRVDFESMGVRLLNPWNDPHDDPN